MSILEYGLFRIESRPSSTPSGKFTAFGRISCKDGTKIRFFDTTGKPYLNKTEADAAYQVAAKDYLDNTFKIK